MDRNTVLATTSAVTGLLATGAACWSAASAIRSNRQAARERRAVLEREASRGLVAVHAAAARVAGLAERLERDYVTQFALAGRNVSAAAPLKERAAERRRAAEEMAANVQRGLEGSFESRSDRELESLLRETDGCTVRLEKLEESLTSDLKSVEEQVRPLRERALGAHEPRGTT